MQIISQNLNGQITSPYTGEVFQSRRETDIEHIVATSEAHDSGLCAASAATKKIFARDLDNLTLASPSLNRHQKRDKDLAEWLPPQNQCWYVKTVVDVKAKYGLSMDSQEADVAINTLKVCDPKPACYKPSRADTLNCYAESGESAVPSSPSASNDGCFPHDKAYVIADMHIRRRARLQSSPAQSALQLYDDNGNGRITCAEARNHGIAPVRRGHPAYQYMDDRDNDGIVCE